MVKQWHKPRVRRLAKVVGAVLLITGIALVVIGEVSIKRPVYEPTTASVGMMTYEQISDRQMTVDATFGGITRKDDRLYSTYNRLQTRGKLACPT